MREPVRDLLFDVRSVGPRIRAGFNYLCAHSFAIDDRGRHDHGPEPSAKYSKALIPLGGLCELGGRPGVWGFLEHGRRHKSDR